MKDAKFIHIHRDPRSSTLAYKDVPICANTVDRWINIWTRHTQSMVDIHSALGPDQVLQFAYEDFVAVKGEALLPKIEAFIDVDRASEPLEFLARERETPVPYRSPTTKLDDLDRTTYQGGLSDDEIRKIEETCSELASAVGRPLRP